MDEFVFIDGEAGDAQFPDQSKRPRVLLNEARREAATQFCSSPRALLMVTALAASFPLPRTRSIDRPPSARCDHAVTSSQISSTAVGLRRAVRFDIWAPMGICERRHDPLVALDVPSISEGPILQESRRRQGPFRYGEVRSSTALSCRRPLMASVLVVEDNYTMGIQTASIVEEAGYSVAGPEASVDAARRCWAAKRLSLPFLKYISATKWCSQ